jgi:hypothetical protein
LVIPVVPKVDLNLQLQQTISDKMKIPKVVKRNFVYVGDCIGKIGDVMDRHPLETVGVGSGFLGGLFMEVWDNLIPPYAEFYSRFNLTPGQPTAIATGVCGGGMAAIDLTYRGLRRLHKTYEKWKAELNQIQ